MTWDAAQMRALRRAAGLTQQQLGDALGVSRRSVRWWEEGRRPYPANLRALARLLGLTDAQPLVAAGPGPDLRELRSAAGLTQVTAAKALGMSARKLGRYESGERLLAEPHDLWARLYGVPVEALAAAAERSVTSG